MISPVLATSWIFSFLAKPILNYVNQMEMTVIPPKTYGSGINWCEMFCAKVSDLAKPYVTSLFASLFLTSCFLSWKHS